MSELEKYLKDLGEQGNQEENKIKIVETPELVKLCAQFGEFLRSKYDTVKKDEDEIKYNLAGVLVREINYTAKDVLSFSIKLKEYENRENFSRVTGLFLAALTNNSEEENFNIITEHLSNQFTLLGYENKKNLTILGDTWDGVGFKLRNGKITIMGDVGMNSGSDMTGGELIIEGNAGDLIGPDMTGGVIRVKKNAKGWVGALSNGGEIYVDGELENTLRGRLAIEKSGRSKAKIYHKGKQIWPE